MLSSDSDGRGQLASEEAALVMATLADMDFNLKFLTLTMLLGNSKTI